MHIVAKEMKPEHRDRIKVGTELYSMEGAHKVAKGIVTRITGLVEDGA